MPLSKKKNRDRMRVSRATQVQPKVVQPTSLEEEALDPINNPSQFFPVQPTAPVCNLVQPKRHDIKAKLEKAGLTLDGNSILDAVQSRPVKEESLPRYNPAIHRPGDTVLVLRGKRWLPYLIPEVDASGQAIPDYW